MIAIPLLHENRFYRDNPIPELQRITRPEYKFLWVFVRCSTETIVQDGEKDPTSNSTNSVISNPINQKCLTPKYFQLKPEQLLPVGVGLI